MLILHGQDIKKYYGDRLILDIKDIKVYSNDKIGIAGLNGAGKTTLFEILSGNIEPDEGNIKLFADYSYIRQFGREQMDIDGRIAKELKVRGKSTEHMSGGEETRYKIAQQLSRKSSIILADEPTSNLDMEGITLVQKKLIEYKRAILLISHDRELMDTVCNKVLEITDGKIKLYSGNYSSYKKQKEMEIERQKFEYNEYISEKKKLEAAITDRSVRADKIRKAPKRMGNSEARLGKRRSTEIQKKLRNTVKSIETRLEKLEIKDKAEFNKNIKMEFKSINEPVSKFLVKGKNLKLAFADRILFDGVEFDLIKGTKTALIGENGSGKTTLLKMIISEDKNIEIAPDVRIGYFSQKLDVLNNDETILQNIMNESIQSEWIARTVLARLLFKREDVHKKVGILSGGEKVKVSFAKLLVSHCNLLILDEPTNYLDLFSIEALQEVLSEYKGTILFVSHDRRFVDVISDRIIFINRLKTTTFEGNYSQYLDKEKQMEKKNNVEIEEMILKMRLAKISSELSMPKKNSNIEELDKEYKRLLMKIKYMKN